MRTGNNYALTAFLRSLVFLTLLVTAGNIFAQTEVPPAPAAPKTASIPAVKEKKLKNGMTVAVVERTSVPLVTVQLMVPAGAALEPAEKAGLADLTATMLTKGTKSRTATQIAEDMDFLGASLDTGAGWNNSTVSVTVTPDKLERAMAIMADLVLNPKFDQKELDLLKSQTLDGLNYNLKQPSFLANYVATKFSFGEHPAGGTPASIASIAPADVASFHSKYYLPNGAVMVFAGDITADRAASLTEKAFGSWKSTGTGPVAGNTNENRDSKQTSRLLVVDLPNSGQAAVSYYRPIASVGRGSEDYYPASVMNSVLGGGYSSRLNQEIRIKRGLSYGAGSSFAWRSDRSNFSTRAQTKNESAAQVAELTLEEVKKLTSGSVASDELVPRKSVLTGNFGRNLETTSGLANAIAELYSFGIPTSELNKYMSNVNAISDAQIREFAGKNLLGGDFIIVGDYSVFKDDLAKRFPDMKVQVVKAADLDLSKDGLAK
jgi:zinc protease